MKKIRFLFVLVVTTTLTSCNFTENIDVQSDGTGTFALEIDGAGLMAMAGDNLGKEFGAKNNAKAIDSTFSFKQIFEDKKDSIAKLTSEQQEVLKKLESFVMKIKMNPEAKQFLFSIKNDFKSLNELQDVSKVLHSLQDLEGKNDQQAQEFTKMIENNAEVSFNYSFKKFTRTSNLLAKDKKKEIQDSEDMSKMFFQSSNYVLKYSFPKKIKKVSNTEAIVSDDKKTVTIQYPFTEYMENPKKLDLVVEFE